MAQKKQAGKKNKKSAGKNSFSKPVSPSARKAGKAGVKKKTAGSNKKKQAPTGRKSSVKKPSPTKIKSAKVKKSPKKRIEKKKTVAKSSVKSRKVTGTPRKAKASARPSSLSELTATERYSAGGLFACAIERTSDPDFTRLRSVLRELDLPSLEKDNLIRLSQGFTIPKLFADSIAPHKAGSLVEGLVKFAVGDGGYERKWKNDIRQVAVWLGLEGPAVEAIERRAASK